MSAEQQLLQPITVRIPDACRMTGISRSKLYELIAAGEIEVLKVGRATLIRVVSLNVFITRRRNYLPPPHSK